MRTRLGTLITVALVSLLAQYANAAGTTSAQILRLDGDARASALGSAYCGVSDDMGALTSNPAGLSQIHFKEAAFSFIDLYQELSFTHVGYVHPLENGYTLAAALSLLDSGEITRTLATSRGLYLGNSGSFRATSSLIHIAASREMANLEDMSVGVNIKRISEGIDGYNAATFNFDIGVLFKTMEDRLSLGFSVLNILGTLALGEQAAAVPLTLKAGAGYRLKNLLICMDINKISDSNLSYHTGLEYRVAELLALRLGYNSLTDSNLTMGIGLKVRAVNFDYMLSSSQYLGFLHKVTTSLRFGQQRFKPRVRDYKYNDTNKPTPDWFNNIYKH